MECVCNYKEEGHVNILIVCNVINFPVVSTVENFISPVLSRFILVRCYVMSSYVYLYLPLSVIIAWIFAFLVNHRIAFTYFANLECFAKLSKILPKHVVIICTLCSETLLSLISMAVCELNNYTWHS